MLKWTRRILLFLLLGAIANAAVAWGCAAASVNQLDAPFRKDQIRWFTPSDGAKRVYLDVISRGGFERVKCGYSLEILTFEVEFFRLDSEIQQYTGPIWWHVEQVKQRRDMQFASGWPQLALRAQHGIDWEAHHRSASPTGVGIVYTRWESAIDLSCWSDAPASLANVVLPLKVIPMGFALNAVFYGAVLLSLATAIPAARSAMRRKRGLCPACAYPRGTSPVCTECGEPLPC